MEKDLQDVLEAYYHNVKVVIIDIHHKIYKPGKLAEASKPLLLKLGWMSPDLKIKPPGFIQTFDEIKRDGKNFVRYMAVRREDVFR